MKPHSCIMSIRCIVEKTMTNTTHIRSNIYISNSINLSSTKSLVKTYSLTSKSNLTNSNSNQTTITSKVGSTITYKGSNRSHGCIHHVYRPSSIKVRYSIAEKHTSSLASNSNLSLSNKSRNSSSLEASSSNS